MAKIQFIQCNSKETLLFPPNLGDFIPKDSPVRLFNEVLDLVDISAVVEEYHNRANGRAAYNPRMLLKVVLYGYFNDIYSTRDLEAAMERDAHLIWLSSYQFPDHSTISRFKIKCVKSIKEIFTSMVEILVKKGEIQLSEDLYIDGTTIRSRAARRSIKWRNSAERFSAIAEEKIKKAIDTLLLSVDESYSNELIEKGRVTYTPEDARALADEIEKHAIQNGLKIKSKINAVREACDSKQAHDKTLELCDGRCGIAPTDPECGIMHAKEDGYDAKPTPNYNVQVATQNQYVTNYEVFDTPSDKATAMDFVETCVSENGVKPQAVVEDAGYGCEEVYDGLEKMGIEAVVKYPNFDSDTKRRPVKEGVFDKNGFKLTPEQDNLICPAGHAMEKLHVIEDYTERGFRNDITKFTCHCHQECPFKDRCPVSKSKRKTIGRRLGNMRQEAKAKERLLSPKNQQRLRRRNLEPEPVFGQLKHDHGYNRFRHFGKAKVRMDLGLMLMSLNLRKLYKNTHKSA